MANRFRAPGMLTTYGQSQASKPTAQGKYTLIYEREPEPCHPGDGTKGLHRLAYLAEPLLRFDLQQELQ